MPPGDTSNFCKPEKIHGCHCFCPTILDTVCQKDIISNFQPFVLYRFLGEISISNRFYTFTD